MPQDHSDRHNHSAPTPNPSIGSTRGARRATKPTTSRPGWHPVPTAANTAHCSHGGVATAHASHAMAATPLRAAGKDHAPTMCHATGTHPSVDTRDMASRRPVTIKGMVDAHGLTVIVGSACHTTPSMKAKAKAHSTALYRCNRGTTGACCATDCAEATNICTDRASKPSAMRSRFLHTRLPISVYAKPSDHASRADTHALGHSAGDHARSTSAASINVATGSTT